MSRPAGIPNGSRQATFAQLLAIESDDCVIWPHSTNSKGYGLVQTNGKVQTVHSVVCAMHNGPRPEGKQVAHSCGVRACMNYRHVRWATQAENEADKRIHGTVRAPSEGVVNVYVFRTRPSRSEQLTELSVTPLSCTLTVAEWGQVIAAVEMSDYDTHHDLARQVRHLLTHPPRSS